MPLIGESAVKWSVGFRQIFGSDLKLARRPLAMRTVSIDTESSVQWAFTEFSLPFRKLRPLGEEPGRQSIKVSSFPNIGSSSGGVCRTEGLFEPS